jgi:two-component system phosphate regulon response regulator PhoB
MRHMTSEHDESQIRRSTARILIAARDEVRGLLKYIVDREGFRSAEATSIKEVSAAMNEGSVAVIVLDANSSSISIEEVARLLARSTPGGMRVIVVNAEVTDALNELPGYQNITFLPRPSSPPQLLEQLHILAPAGSAASDTRFLVFADIVMDLGRHRVYRGNRSIRLVPLEFRLLRFLMQHPRQVFSRQDLLEAVWSGEVYVEARTVDVYIGRLRRALSHADEPDLVRTIRAAGYSLDTED